MRKIRHNTKVRSLGIGFVVLTFLTAQVAGIRLFNTTIYAEGQVNAQQVTLNPGGGIESDGSDGIRFTINSDQDNGGNFDYDEADAGQDGVVYRGTYQYCCSAGGPMLNIGGQLYGQSGPADDNSSPLWDSIEVVSTSGSATVGTRTSTTGNASATVRYTVEHNDLSYSFDRTVTYVHPNDYVTDTYTFHIPTGNTEVVKFYLGGDTAPGSSDVGYGIMLTSPVRTIISLNPESEILFGFREAPGSRPFDGATSQDFYAPYSTVQSGGDIGFVGEDEEHDAGLMMQWNLGTTPGTQTASLQQFTTPQGTNLNASFSAASTNPNVPVNLNFSIVNTVLDEADSLGFTAALPAGLKIDSGSTSNSCGGSLTATPGSANVVLSNGVVGGAANCVVSVPVVASELGTYTISSNGISGLAGLINNVGTSSLEVGEPQGDSSDLNGDSIPDEDQEYVSAVTSSVTGKTVVLEAGNACSIDTNLIKAESSHAVQDPGFDYPQGLMNFTVDCGTPGYTTAIKQYYYGVTKDALVARKYNPTTNAYFAVPGATVSQTSLNGQTVTVLSYQVTDGGSLDVDNTQNGVIVDPAGLAASKVGAPNTGLRRQ